MLRLTLSKRISTTILVILAVILLSYLIPYLQRNNKVLYVGVDGYSAPFSSANHMGELKGFNIDLAKAIAKSLDAKVEFRILPFNDLEKNLKQKKIDMIIGPFDTHNIVLPKDYVYSVPYFKNNLVLIKRKQDRDSELFRRNSTKDSSYCITDKPHVLNYVRRKFSDKTIKIYENSQAALQAIYLGECSAIIDSYSSANYYITKHKLKHLTIISLENTTHYHLYRIVLNLEDISLKNKINDAILYMSQTGQLDKISQKWFSQKSTIRENVLKDPAFRK